LNSGQIFVNASYTFITRIASTRVPIIARLRLSDTVTIHAMIIDSTAVAIVTFAIIRNV